MNPLQRYISIFVWGIFLFLLPLSMSAQRPAFHPQTHELGLRATSFHSTPALADFYPDGPGTLQFANGLQYKFHWDLYNVFRFTAGKRDSKFETLLEGTDANILMADKQDLDFRLGYEGNMPLGMITLLGGIEGVYNSQSIDFQTLSPVLANEVIDQSSISYSSWGANAFGGIRLFFSEHLSTTLEGNVTFLDSDYESAFANFQPDLAPSEWNLEVNLYITIHFVKLKKRCACGG